MVETRSGERAKERTAAVGASLHLPEATVTTAKTMFDQVHSELDFEGRKADQLAAAALTIACKNASLPVTVNDITNEWSEVADDQTGDFPVKFVSRRLDTVSETTGVSPPPTDPTGLTRRYAQELNVPKRVATAADNILQDLMESSPEIITRGTAPSGNAAAALYLAARVNDARLEFTQSDIGDVADVTEVTIRNRYQEMAEALGGEASMSDSERYALKVESDDEKAGVDDRGIANGTKPISGDSPIFTADENQRSVADKDGVTPEPSASDISDGEVTTLHIGLPAYLAVRSEAASKDLDESETVIEVVRDALKSLLDGHDLTPPESTNTVSITVKFPSRVGKLLDAEVSDPTCRFDSRGAFVTAAIAESMETELATVNEIETVELPDYAVQAARRIVDNRAEYATLVDLIREGAYERVVEG